jgi:hypothetical protein
MPSGNNVATAGVSLTCFDLNSLTRLSDLNAMLSFQNSLLNSAFLFSSSYVLTNVSARKLIEKMKTSETCLSYENIVKWQYFYRTRYLTTNIDDD